MTTLADVYAAFGCNGQFYVGPNERELIRVALATILANRLGYSAKLEPLWVMLVAPSGGMKSTVMMSMDGCYGLEMCDTAAENAFVSGYRDKDTKVDPSWLKQLDGKTICMKDMTHMMSKPKEATAFLGALRTAYDGVSSRRTGNLEDTTRHEAHLGMLGGLVLDSLDIIEQQRSLGERFLVYRYRMDHKARTAISQAAGGAIINISRHAAPVVRSFLDGAGNEKARRPFTPVDNMKETPEFRALIQSLGRSVPYIRGLGSRSRKATGEVEPEGPGRLVKQLRWLGYGLAALEDSTEVRASTCQSVFSNVIKASTTKHTLAIVKTMWINRDSPSAMTVTKIHALIGRRYWTPKEQITQVVREMISMAEPLAEDHGSAENEHPFRLTELGREVLDDFFGSIK